MDLTSVRDQAIAATIKGGLDHTDRICSEAIINAQTVAAESMQAATEALSESLNYIEGVRDFVSHPNNILGSDQTKHGEIAEQIDVAIRNGRSILDGLKPTATFDGVGRTAPEDYILDGIRVQSKFINNVKGSLQHSIDHFDKYSEYMIDGKYVIPKDQYEVVLKILRGESVENYSSSYINRCKEIINGFEIRTGKPIEEVVCPSVAEYNDSQIGKVNDFLNDREDEFYDKTITNLDDIRDNEREKIADAKADIAPSINEALKYGVIAASISAVLAGGLSVYSKLSGGKKISEFTLDDWKDVGYDFGAGGVKGGVTGMGIYGLTKLCRFPAPLAGASVSAVIGVASLANDYRVGKLTEEEFSESALSLSVEAGIAAIGAAIGQVVIPIPALGAIVGSVVSKVALEGVKVVMNNKTNRLVEKMQRDYDEMVSRLDEQSKAMLQKIDGYYKELGGYIEASLSPISAVRFYASIDLCKFLGIEDDDIIKSLSECDDYMMA